MRIKNIDQFTIDECWKYLSQNPNGVDVDAVKKRLNKLQQQYLISWINSSIFCQRKNLFFLKFSIYCIVGAIIFLFIGLWADGEFTEYGREIMCDEVYITSYYISCVLLIIGVFNCFLKKKYLQKISNLTHVENNLNSSILIGKNFFGKVGLYKFGIFTLTQLLPAKYDKIKKVGDYLYIVEENGTTYIYNVLTKKSTPKPNN